MEIVGYDNDGKELAANFQDFATELASKSERFIGLGSSKEMAKYRNLETGTEREVDLRIEATKQGLSRVKLNFNKEAAKKQNLYNTDVDIDQGVAYNLARIKTEDGRQKYLTSRQYTGTFNEGDDWYGIKDGMIVPLNNKDGIDVSDFTRMGARAGQDIGATAGVLIAGVGATAVGPLALTVAGSAGAAGAAAGEFAQQAIDKWVVGADAANFRGTDAEEGRAIAQAAAEGAVGGVLGQGMAAGIMKYGAKALGAVSKGANALGLEGMKEWTALQAAKTEAGYLSGKMPTGLMKKALGNTQDEAVARSMLSDVGQAKKAADAEAILADAKSEQLARGKSKLTIDTAEQGAENQRQSTLRENFKGQAQRKLEEERRAAIADQMDKTERGERLKVHKETMIHNTVEHFKNYKGDVAEIFDAKGDADNAYHAMKRIENSWLKGFKDIVIEEKNGLFNGFQKDSFNAYTQKTVNEAISEIGSKAEEHGLAAFTFGKVPDDSTRGAAVDAINTLKAKLRDDPAFDVVAAKSNISEKQRIFNAAEDLISAISDHDMTSGADVGHRMNQFLATMRDIADRKGALPSVFKSADDVSAKLLGYARAGTENPKAVPKLEGLQEKLMGIHTSRRKAVFDEGGEFAKMITDLNEAAFLADLGPNTEVKKLAFVSHIQESMKTGAKTPYWNLMKPEDRMTYNGLELLRDSATSKTKTVSTVSSRVTERQNQTSELEAGISRVKKGYKYAKAGIKATKEVVEKVPTPSRQQVTRAATNIGAEETIGSVSKYLQKWTARGNNRED